VVRTQANKDEYVRLFGLIAKHGVWKEWKDGRRYWYWYRGGWKYWAMTNDVRQSRVINRAGRERARAFSHRKRIWEKLGGASAWTKMWT
jgi:hypothetical protein